MIRPLCASVTPFPDESLISLIARAAVSNEMPSLAKLLQFADVLAPNPAFTAFTQDNASENIASLLGLHRSAIEWRMHRRLGDRASLTVNWFGTPLERRFIEAGGRRYSASGIQRPYGRLSWMIKPLFYCSETLETLNDTCPQCKKALGWVRTHGLDRCDKCKATLDAGSVKLDRSLTAEAVHIANLVHHSPEIRDAEVARLPAPFCEWHPGEVFGAVVDFGVAAANPLAPHSNRLGHQVATGDFTDLPHEAIFLGWQLIRGWPNSLVPLVETIMSGNTPKRRLNAAPLGPLARHLSPNARPTKFRKLLREMVPQVLPLTSTSERVVPHLEKRSALADALTASEAAKMLGVSSKTLRRLDHRAQRMGTHVQLPSSVKLYDRKLVRHLLEARAGALEPTAAAECLGIPLHVIPYLRDRGFLTAVECEDLILLAGGRELIRRDSVDALVEDVLSRCRSGKGREIVSLQRALQHQLNPSVWVGAIERILSGKLGVTAVERSGPLVSAVCIRNPQLRRLLPHLDVRPTKDTSVQIGVASSLMRVSYPVLLEAAALGLIERLGTGLSLWSLLDVQSRYVFPAEVADWFSKSCHVFRNVMQVAGAKPVANLCKVNIWDRRDVLRIFPESSRTEFTAI